MPILKVTIRQKIDPGIRQESLLGMVSEYECREVAKKSLYTWTQWLDLDTSERAACIAHNRLGLAIEAHVSEAYTKYSERLARQHGR